MLKKILFGLSLIFITKSKMSLKLENTVKMNTASGYDMNQIMGMYYVSPASYTGVVGGGMNSNTNTNVATNAVVNSINMNGSDNSKINLSNNLLSNIKQ